MKFSLGQGLPKAGVGVLYETGLFGALVEPWFSARARARARASTAARRRPSRAPCPRVTASATHARLATAPASSVNRTGNLSEVSLEIKLWCVDGALACGCIDHYLAWGDSRGNCDVHLLRLHRLSRLRSNLRMLLHHRRRSHLHHRRLYSQAISVRNIRGSTIAVAAGSGLRRRAGARTGCALTGTAIMASGMPSPFRSTPTICVAGCCCCICLRRRTYFRHYSTRCMSRRKSARTSTQ